MTVNVYGVPLVSPLTVQGELEHPTLVNPPGEDVTVYAVIGSPPVFAGAWKETVADASPAVALTFVGATGADGTWATATSSTRT
ncbi:hypothetical protein ASG00_04835 [Microbacterium sp. Leaf351]|nr:hypothetical protein ASG00_04835 [Microbacterium sp. Leaf351]